MLYLLRTCEMDSTIVSHHKKYGKCNGNTIVVDH